MRKALITLGALCALILTPGVALASPDYDDPVICERDDVRVTTGSVNGVTLRGVPDGPAGGCQVWVGLYRAPSTWNDQGFNATALPQSSIVQKYVTVRPGQATHVPLPAPDCGVAQWDVYRGDGSDPIVSLTTAGHGDRFFAGRLERISETCSTPTPTPTTASPSPSSTPTGAPTTGSPTESPSPTPSTTGPTGTPTGTPTGSPTGTTGPTGGSSTTGTTAPSAPDEPALVPPTSQTQEPRRSTPDTEPAPPGAGRKGSTPATAVEAGRLAHTGPSGMDLTLLTAGALTLLGAVVMIVARRAYRDNS